MMYVWFFIISFAASVIGAVCGIGGGVLMKPLLDAFGILDVRTISFLSGCTVLCMSMYSFVSAKLRRDSLIEMRTGTLLALGAVAGGSLGKSIFQVLTERISQNLTGVVQAGCLLLLTAGTLLYTLYKARIHTIQIKNALLCVLCGFGLGILSSFLGIGGGPVNLMVLSYFFSMPAKTAAQNSLYIILFSQISSLVNSLVAGTVPAGCAGLIVLMSLGGIAGGMLGRRVGKHMDGRQTDHLFIAAMAGIIVINIYNIIHFLNL